MHKRFSSQHRSPSHTIMVTTPRHRLVRTLLLPVLLTVLTSALAAAQSFETLRAQGYDLPPRLGVRLSLYSQTQAYDIDSLTIGIPGIDPSLLNGISIRNRTKTDHAIVDYWLFPFLDVFALGGHVEGTTQVDLSNLNLGLPIRLNNLSINYNGTVYGGGITLAGGWKHYFGSLTYEATNTSLNVSSSSITAWVSSLQLGYKVQGAAVYVGAMYQHTDEHDRGSYTMPYFGSFPYNVQFAVRHAINYQIGVTATVNEHWNLLFEGGFGNRRSTMVSLGYRF